MFERLASFFRELPGRTGEDRADADDPHIAAAALMFHVVDADGTREQAERERLRQTLSQAYGLTGRKLESVLAAGEIANRRSMDFVPFTGVLARTLSDDAKAEFIDILWKLARADGETHELEDNAVIRIGELLEIPARGNGPAT